MSAILKCTDCHMLTTKNESDDRNFNTGRCGYCDGTLKEVAPDLSTYVCKHGWSYFNNRMECPKCTNNPTYVNNKIPVEYSSPERVPDGETARDIDVPNNVNKNTETVQVELREKITYGIDKGSPNGDYTAFSITCNSELFNFVGGEAEAIIELLSLKDTEHAKAIEMAKIEAALNEWNTMLCYRHNTHITIKNEDMNNRLLELTKQKEEI